MTLPIDGFGMPENDAPPLELPVQITYENFMTQYDGRASALFSQFLRENAEIRAQAQQLMFERDAARAEAEAAKVALKEFMQDAEADAVRQAKAPTQ